MPQLLSSGLYVVRNAAYADRVADLSGGQPEPNTPIIGWSYHKGENQQWELQPSPGGSNTYALRSKISSGVTYFALSDVRIFPPLIAGQPDYVMWSIEPVGDGKFRLHFPYVNGVATLRSEKEGTQLTLDPWEGEPHQMWRIEAV
ncbi:RICIN domain-containing protein [Streptomyces sp. E11-3]|uniref:RICIN domain-containing protein n=1 Tax=Streptomyces sp. E11-3 TaxID=3110112 RepID=UPI00397F9DE9